MPSSKVAHSAYPFRVCHETPRKSHPFPASPNLLTDSMGGTERSWSQEGRKQSPDEERELKERMKQEGTEALYTPFLLIWKIRKRLRILKAHYGNIPRDTCDKIVETIMANLFRTGTGNREGLGFELDQATLPCFYFLTLGIIQCSSKKCQAAICCQVTQILPLSFKSMDDI